jgi:transitional endoplasmic reticulum ATPase
MTILENIIKVTKPTITLQELQKYEMVRAKMNGEKIEQINTRPRIGFKP